MDKTYSIEKPRCFHPTSTLHKYLSHRRPGSIPLENRKYSLSHIILSLMEIIEDDRLFDPANPMIIICDTFMEEALQIKAFHLTDLKRIISRQLFRIPENHKTYFLHDGCEIPINDFDDNIATHALPAWGNPIATAVLARQTMTTKFDTFALYEMSPNLRDTLKEPCNIHKKRRYFPYNEIICMFSYYINKNRYKLFDPRNPLVAIVKDDPLGKALEVKAFHQKQAISLLRHQLTIKPYRQRNEIHKRYRDNKQTTNYNNRYRNNKY